MAWMLLAILSGLCGIGSLTAVVPALEASVQLSDRVAAVINTEVIMLSELDDAMSDEIIRLQARYDGEEFEAQLLQKQYQALNRIIERKIQLQEAREKEITVTEEEVDKAWAQVQQNPGAYLPEFIRSRDVFREEMVLRRVAEFEVQRRILVPFEEVRDYYQEREQDFVTPPAYYLLRRNNGPGGPQPAPSSQPPRRPTLDSCSRRHAPRAPPRGHQAAAAPLDSCSRRHDQQGYPPRNESRSPGFSQ